MVVRLFVCLSRIASFLRFDVDVEVAVMSQWNKRASFRILKWIWNGGPVEIFSHRIPERSHHDIVLSSCMCIPHVLMQKPAMRVTRLGFHRNVAHA